MRSILLFIRLSRPLFLLGAIVLYSLGVGIVQYLDEPINWGIFILGMVWAVILQLSAHYFNEYYNALADQTNPNRTPFTGGSGAVGDSKLDRQVPLIAGLTCLALLTSVSVLIISRQNIEPVVYLIMLLSFLGAILYSLPPVSLESSGFGELTTSILVAFMLPAFGYTLQTGEIHRYLAMSTFPLVTIHIAMMIAFEFPDYGTDIKFNKRTILTRMGWQNGMNFHNMMIVISFVLLLIMWLLGLPRTIVLHGFIALPLGVIQIWQIVRIRQGYPPNWTIFGLNALATFGAMCYFLTLAYWTN